MSTYVHLRVSSGSNVIVLGHPWHITNVCIKFGENRLRIVELYTLVIIHTHLYVLDLLINMFVPVGLKITIETNLILTDFLDVMLDLGSGAYGPYRKPNERLMYINTVSCHPTIVLKNLVNGINKRITNLSFNQEIFDAAAPYYIETLAATGLKDHILYMTESYSSEQWKEAQ